MTWQQKEKCLQPENGKIMEGIHTNHWKTQNKSKNKKKFSNENNVAPKDRHVSPREKGMNDPSIRKIP